MFPMRYTDLLVSGAQRSRLCKWHFPLLYIAIFVALLIGTSSSCEPGANQFARWMMEGMDMTELASMQFSTEILPRALANGSSNVTTTIFHNGSIITLAGGTYSPVDALVVVGDSIEYAGSLEGAKAAGGSGAVTLDLNGRSIVPGFVEPHLHLILSALAEYDLLSLSALVVTSLDQAKAVIKDAIDNGKILNGGWVAGYGYDPSRVTDHPDLTVDVLDAISKDNPIFILNQSGHVAYANTAALAAAGVTAGTVAGDSNYQQVDGKLTGVLFEQAVQFVGKNVPVPKAADMVKYCVATLNGWMSKGVTTIFDAGIGSVGITDIPLMAAVPATPIRFHGALSSLITQNLAAIIKEPPFKLGAVEITSIKFWADGSTQGFTAAVNEPYLHPPQYANPHGIKNYANATVLQAAMSPWLKAGFQLIVHSNGDASSDMVLDAYEAIFTANPTRNSDILHRIEHFTVTRPDQLTCAKALGLSVSHTIGHVNFWGQTFSEYVLGPDRASRIDPLKSDADAGLVWSLHSDSPVTDVAPLLYLKTATTRLMYPNYTQVLGESERVDLLTALKAITVSPATQMGLAGVVGSLEVGKKADFVVLERDLRGVELASLDTVTVEETWIGGMRVYSRL